MFNIFFTFILFIYLLGLWYELKWRNDITDPNLFGTEHSSFIDNFSIFSSFCDMSSCFQFHKKEKQEVYLASIMATSR